MKRKKRYIPLIICYSFLASIAQAQVPAQINYQGRLVDGTNLVNGTVGLALNLYTAPTGGTLLYTDSNTVTVVDGLYNTHLGANTTFGNLVTALNSPWVWSEPQVWLEVVVNGTPLAPRERLISVPYAHVVRGLHVSPQSGVTLGSAAADNYAFESYSTVGGGQENYTYDDYATVSGGSYNQARGYASTIGGGSDNRSEGNYSTVSGGFDSHALEMGSTVGGGMANWAPDEYSTVSGGRQNHAGGIYSSIGGGFSNRTIVAYASVSGGRHNTAGALYASISGGHFNEIRSGAQAAIIGGGQSNVIHRFSTNSVIAGGRSNQIFTNSVNSVIGGGLENTMTGSRGSVIGGGWRNAMGSNDYSVIAGGAFNRMTNAVECAISGGGGHNVIDSHFSSVVGGANNVIRNSIGATVIGSFNTLINAHYSFVGGYGAGSTNEHTFVWNETSWKQNQLVMKFTNGFYLSTTASGPPVYVALEPGSTSWAVASDREAKENIEEINHTQTLERLVALPVTAWSYKGSENPRRHIGPMAQDFHAAFGLGGDTMISTMDSDGVLFSAVKGLNEKFEKRIEELEAENAQLREELQAIRAHLGL